MRVAGDALVRHRPSRQVRCRDVTPTMNEPSQAHCECPCCGATDLRVEGPIPRHFRFAGSMLDEPSPASDLVACQQCHLRFRWPAPSVDELGRLYNLGENEQWAYQGHERQDWKLARSIIASFPEPGTILDVGCWDGQFAAMLPPGWQCAGIEIHEGAASRAAAAGIEMIGRSFDDVTGREDCFDAVVSFDVAEHVHNPAALVDEMLRLARPGGLVVVGTGNTQALSWRVMGSGYWYCGLPEHIAFIGEDWCRWYAADRGVELAAIHRYSHAPKTSLTRSIMQTAANGLYRCSPTLVGWLRSLRAQGDEPRARQAARTFPPNWTTARDHVMAVFRAPKSVASSSSQTRAHNTVRT